MNELAAARWMGGPMGVGVALGVPVGRGPGVPVWPGVGVGVALLVGVGVGVGVFQQNGQKGQQICGPAGTR